MATDRTEPQPSSDDLAQQIAALYAAAETYLLAQSTALVQRLVRGDLTVEQVIAAVRQLIVPVTPRLAAADSVVARMVTMAAAEGDREARQSVSKALARIPKTRRPHAGSGGGGALPPAPGRELGLPDEPFDLSLDHGERAAQAIRDDVVSTLEDVRRRITRLPDDIYKAIAPHGAIGQVRDNGFTPAQAQAVAWRVFVQSGVTGLTDRSGRDWTLSAYTEMAVRTASQRAFNDSHLQRMQAIGVRYFTIPVHTGACPLCFPWQHRILTAKRITHPEMHVDGTIADAVAAGLFHPNCRHPLTPVFPGVTELSAPEEWTDDHQAAYDATQKQRAIEREIRKAKRRLEYAADPDERAAARVKVRRQQARMREFLASRDDLSRNSRREQLSFSNQKIKIPTIGG